MTCGVPNGHTFEVTCTREEGHPGLHQHNNGPYWSEDVRRGRCLYARVSDHARCALPRDHWEAHLDVDGAQFTRREAVQILRPSLYKPDENVAPTLDQIDREWPAPTLWERLLP